MNIYGYVRVRSESQNEDRQMLAMDGLKIPKTHIYFSQPLRKYLRTSADNPLMLKYLVITASRSNMPFVADFKKYPLSLSMKKTFALDEHLLSYNFASDRSECSSAAGYSSALISIGVSVIIYSFSHQRYDFLSGANSNHIYYILYIMI